MSSITFARFGPAAPLPQDLPEAPSFHGSDQRLGELLREVAGLDDADLQRIVAHAGARRLRFGDAAVALGLATPEQILQALTRQFHYAYTPYGTHQPSTELIALAQPFTLQAESFRAIRSQLLLRAPGVDPRHKALAVVSHRSGDGKTFFCANLAVTLAQLGGRTLLIDADLRGPRQHRIFPVDNAVGLSGYLMGRVGEPAIQPCLQVPGLSILPVGASPPNPQELIERPAFGALMHEACQRFDHVIVDTPAAAYGADAQVITNRCGRVLVMARKDRSRIGELHRLSASMKETRAQLIGVVFNEF
jgi:chain length determinant protein tyrosine kinase EpsG